MDSRCAATTGAFRLAVNRALAELYRSGSIVPIYDRWFGGFGKPMQAIQAMYLLNEFTGMKLPAAKLRGILRNSSKPFNPRYSAAERGAVIAAPHSRQLGVVG